MAGCRTTSGRCIDISNSCRPCETSNIRLSRLRSRREGTCCDGVKPIGWVVTSWKLGVAATPTGPEY
ncbi:hypothetical protein HYQ46_011330 [Verticillium longisporum]|nr:hypothetical protein HYQ46_011330 [Verticillium longisporum]